MKNHLFSFSMCWWERTQNQSLGFFKIYLGLRIHILHKFIPSLKTSRQKTHRQNVEPLRAGIYPESIEYALAFNLKKKRKTLLLYASKQAYCCFTGRGRHRFLLNWQFSVLEQNRERAKEIILLLVFSLQRAFLDQVHDCSKKMLSCKKNVSAFVLIHY